MTTEAIEFTLETLGAIKEKMGADVDFGDINLGDLDIVYYFLKLDPLDNQFDWALVPYDVLYKEYVFDDETGLDPEKEFVPVRPLTQDEKDEHQRDVELAEYKAFYKL